MKSIYLNLENLRYNSIVSINFKQVKDDFVEQFEILKKTK